MQGGQGPLTWIDEICAEFHAHNYLGLPIEEVPYAKIDSSKVHGG